MATSSNLNLRDRIRQILNSMTGQRLKKLGFYGFMFFLIKGLLWLIIPALILYFGWDIGFG